MSKSCRCRHTKPALLLPLSSTTQRNSAQLNCYPILPSHHPFNLHIIPILYWVVYMYVCFLLIYTPISSLCCRRCPPPSLLTARPSQDHPEEAYFCKAGNYFPVFNFLAIKSQPPLIILIIGQIIIIIFVIIIINIIISLIIKVIICSYAFMCTNISHLINYANKKMYKYLYAFHLICAKRKLNRELADWLISPPNTHQPPSPPNTHRKL